MKKFVAVLVICLILLSVFAPVSVTAKDTASATILSLVMPGTGEWFNNGYKDAFPWGECVVGHICFCFMLSSAVDAANGNTDTNMRFDFWSAPTR